MIHHMVKILNADEIFDRDSGFDGGFIKNYCIRELGYRPAPPSTLPRQAIRTTVPSQTGVHLGIVGLIDATKN